MSQGHVPSAGSHLPSAVPSGAGRVAGQRGCVAVIGDVHSAWTWHDVAYFNRSEYELVLVAGDLGGSRARDGLSIARSMAALAQRTLVMPGNNDVDEYGRIAAELTYRRGRVDLLGDADRVSEPPGGTSGVRTCGYSLHPVRIGSLDVTIVAGRPFSRGGPEVSFPDALELSFGVRSIEQSRARLVALVDAAATEHLIFIAHNGPFGLGGAMSDPWGRDFHDDAGDWGDHDLRDAVAHASASGRHTLAVVAGHMHWTLRSGGQRQWQVRKDGILYVNAARVPRIFEATGASMHHHIALHLANDRIEASEVLVSAESEAG